LAGREAERAAQLFRAGVTTEQERDLREATLISCRARQAWPQLCSRPAQLDLDYAFVRSPIAGRVGRIQVTPGNLVGPTLATPLTTVVSVDPLYVYMDVDEARALRLKRGAGRRGTRGLSGRSRLPHEAAVDFVDNRVDPQTGTLKVRAVIKNPDGRWMHGLVRARAAAEEGAHDALLIADQAVATDQDRKFVWVVDQNGKVQPRPVKLGQLDHGLRVVRDGLSSSDRVIVRGLQRVRPSVEVATELVAIARRHSCRGEQAMKFAHFFVERPIFAGVLSIVIFVLGAISAFLLPISEYPEVVPPTVVVRAQYPGASPQVISESVAAPIEQEINGVENMLYMFLQLELGWHDEPDCNISDRHRFGPGAGAGPEPRGAGPAEAPGRRAPFRRSNAQELA